MSTECQQLYHAYPPQVGYHEHSKAGYHRILLVGYTSSAGVYMCICKVCLKLHFLNIFRTYPCNRIVMIVFICKVNGYYCCIPKVCINMHLSSYIHHTAQSISLTITFTIGFQVLSPQDFRYCHNLWYQAD